MTAILLLAFAFTAPPEVPQGRVIRLRAPQAEQGMTAQFDGKSYPIFVNSGSGALALIPVGVFQKPGSYEIVVKTMDGAESQRLPVRVLTTPFRKQNIRATKQMTTLRPAPGEVEKMRALAAMVSPSRFFEDTFAPPVGECQNSPFGVQRLHNGKPTGNYHRGADQRSKAGTPVYAPASGTIAIAQTYFQLNGGTVGIDHGQGLTSHYIHLSEVAVSEGQKVKQGDLIGRVGSTGFATGAHLHWGVVVHGTPVDPNDFVRLQPCPTVAPASRKKKR